MRTATLQLLKQEGEVYFTGLPEKAGGLLDTPDRANLSSHACYVTTVKLRMDADGEICRLTGRSPAPCGSLAPAGFHLPPTAHKLNS